MISFMRRVGLKEILEQQGFILVPGVLSAEEVRSRREILDREFVAAQDASKAYLISSEVLGNEEIYEVCFREPVVRALKEILGAGFTMFADFTVPRNLFGMPKTLHRDCDSEGRKAYLLRPDYRFVKCGVFLQDNDPEWGGGITLVPGGHRFPLRSPNATLNFRVKTLWNMFGVRFRERWVEIKAGDFLAFDSRLPHQSALGSRFHASDIVDGLLPSVPAEHTKYVIYWDASSSASYVADFLANSERRAAREPFFADYLRYVFPVDYPERFVRLVRSASINVASLDEASAEKWKQRASQV